MYGVGEHCVFPCSERNTMFMHAGLTANAARRGARGERRHDHARAQKARYFPTGRHYSGNVSSTERISQFRNDAASHVARSRSSPQSNRAGGLPSRPSMVPG